MAFLGLAQLVCCAGWGGGSSSAVPARNSSVPIHLRHDRYATIVNGHARIVDKRERTRQRDGATMAPAFSLLVEQLHTAASRRSSFSTPFALIAFAKGQQIIFAVTPYVNNCFKSFVAALERELDRSLFEIFEFVIILDDQSFVATACMFACFDQQVEPLLGGVVGDAFEAPIRLGRAK